MRRRVSGGVAMAGALLLAGALGPALLAAADYGPTVTDGTSSNAERKVAVAPDGTLFATFTVAAGNSTAVAVKKSTDGGSTWSFLPTPSSAEAFRSCVAVNARGDLHLAWTEFVGPDRQVFYARFDSGASNWTDRVQLSDTPGYSGFPSIGVDSLNRVHVVWYGFDGTTYQVYYRYLDAAGWHPTTQATHGAQDANNPSIAIGPDNRVHVAFYTYVRGATDVWYMVGGPGGFDLLQRVNPAGVASTSPSIIVEENGTPAIAYVSGSNSSLEVRLAERDAGGNWSYIVAVSALGEGGTNPSAVGGRSGALAVFYETSSGLVRYRVRDVYGWKDPTTIPSAANARWPSASWARFPTVPAAGDVVVILTEETGSGNAVNSTTIHVFALPLCQCAQRPWWVDWELPIAIVGFAVASLAGLWISSARTKGGGRG